MADALHSRIRAAHALAVDALLAERSPCGNWAGELSPSALATATAVSALSFREDGISADLLANALPWLACDQNADGGWGDSPESPSNLATTLLVRAALMLAGVDDPFPLSQADSAPIFPPPSGIDFAAVIHRAEAWLTTRAGASTGERMQALAAVYGKDRTFAVPILLNCALAEMTDWRGIPALPFELACLPHTFWKMLRLHVVSYALPALIAIGQLLHTRAPSRNPLLRGLRNVLRGAALRKLSAIQPDSGGFLEAIPLTAFVTMSLCEMGHARHPVAQRGFTFIESSVRIEGAWPIDTDLTMWLTSSAVSALRASGVDFDAGKTHDFLLAGQSHTIHPYTQTPPGGWAWTDRSGGVPDADDTAGALLALAAERPTDTPSPIIEAATNWLFGLQNSDGGWPTFCRGWQHLPFDQSAPDLTAHVLRALLAWRERCATPHWTTAIARGFAYLRAAQNEDGAWHPLWFGSQHTPDGRNPVLGTTRVLRAFAAAGLYDTGAVMRGVGYVLTAQNADGSWGGAAGVPGSIEETALAIDALVDYRTQDVRLRPIIERGTVYLTERIEEGFPLPAAPIGLYFASLWYSERLYPLIWTVGALGRYLERVPK